MIIEPRTRGFICLTSHPTGCEQNVINQIAYVKSKGKIDGAKKVLVIGASTGFGLASRITSAFGSDAATIGVFFDKPATAGRPGSPGFYNTAAFEQQATKAGLYAKSINGDAFSNEIKDQVVNLIKEDLDRYQDYCKWEKFTESNWSKVLKKHPQLSSMKQRYYIF